MGNNRIRRARFLNHPIEVEVGSGDEPHADSITPRQMMRKPLLLIS